MKIGILTFWNTEDNYGQLLQCYALQHYLQQSGHQTFLLRTIRPDHSSVSLKQQCVEKLRTLYRLLPYPYYLAKRALASGFYLITHGKFRKRHIQLGFEQFRRDYLHGSEIYTLEDLQNNPPLADVFIVGSDQVWNTTDGIFFLSWVKEEVPKIAYAASFGARESTETFCKLIRPWLQRFKHISVREESGIEICKDAGRDDAVCMPDPTLLLSPDDYLRIALDEYPKEKYIMIYFLGTRTTIHWKKIHKFARMKKCRIVYVASQGQEDKYHHTPATIHQWLSLLAHAEYVLTNSFHGTVFSLLFKRPFITYPITGLASKMNDRIITLLTPLGLEGRIYAGSLLPLESPIHWEQVHSLLDLQGRKGRNFLRKIVR